MMAIGGVVLSLSQDTRLARVLIAVIPIVALVFFLIMRKAVPLFQQMQVKIDRLNLVLDEGLTGVRVIRAFDRDAHESRRFDAANLDLTDNAIAVNRLVSLLMPAMFLMMNLTSVAIIWFGAVRIDAGEMQVGAMMASLQYAMQILFCGVHGHGDVRDAAARRRVGGAHQRGARRRARRQRSRRSPRAAGGTAAASVEFENVTFQYPGAEEPALSGVSFTAQPGEVTAIIGGTGSGKSTLAGLIPRFYDVNGGRVLVDGVDVREMRQEDLRAEDRLRAAEGGAVLGHDRQQHPLRPRDATDDEVRHAAAVAQAAEFIDQHAGRLRRAGRAGRHQPVRRPEAAPGDRARAGAATPGSTCSTTASRRSTSPPTRKLRAALKQPRPPTRRSSSCRSASAR